MLAGVKVKAEAVRPTRSDLILQAGLTLRSEMITSTKPRQYDGKGLFGPPRKHDP
jgi:hypothetical protein